MSPWSRDSERYLYEGPTQIGIKGQMQKRSYSASSLADESPSRPAANPKIIAEGRCVSGYEQCK